MNGLQYIIKLRKTIFKVKIWVLYKSKTKSSGKV